MLHSAFAQSIRDFGAVVGLSLALGLVFMALTSWLGGVTSSILMCGPGLTPDHVEEVRDHYRNLGKKRLSVEYYDPVDARVEGLARPETDHACLRYGWTERVPSVIFFSRQSPPSLPVANVSFSWESHQVLPELVWLAPQLAMVLVLVWRSRRPFIRLRQELRQPHWGLISLAAVAGLLLAVLVMALVERMWPEGVSLHHDTSSLVGVGLSILIINFLAPVIEELFFRGLLYRTLLEAGRPFSGAVLTSFMFAGLHVLALAPLLLAEQAYDAIAIVYLTTFSGSVLLCWFYWRYRSLLLCVCVHAAYNLAVAVMALFLVA